METETPRVHHPYSPSTLENLKACPCYKSREDVINERAIAGTLAHSVVESREDNNELSDDDTAAAAECIDFVEGRKQLMAGEGNIIELKEVYLPIDDEITTAGYADHALVSPDQKYAELFDWKFGHWHITKASENLQGIAYCLGLFKKFPTLEVIRFFFKQPHLETVSDAVFTRAQIPELYLQIQVVVARAREARALVAKGDWAMATPKVPVCNFCSLLGRCEKVLAIACKVGNKFYPLEIPAELTPTMVLDPKQTSLAMRLSQVLAVWAGAFRSQVTDRVLRGDAVCPEGFEIRSMSKRTIADPQKFRTIVERYLTPEELQVLDRDNPLGFGVIEKVIVINAPRGQKQAQLEAFQKTLEDEKAVKRNESFSFLKAVSKAENE